MLAASQANYMDVFSFFFCKNCNIATAILGTSWASYMYMFLFFFVKIVMQKQLY